MVLVPEGRTDPLAHGRADYRVEPFSVKKPYPPPKIPIAGLPAEKGERRFVYRGKVRPALVIGTGGSDVPKTLVAGSARWITSKTIFVAPYFGADRDGTRGGWPPAFVDRIRRAEYPQYVWDSLPLNDVKESVLRLDQLQAIGRSSVAIDVLKFRLSEPALTIIDEWLTWLIQGGLPADGFLHDLRRQLLQEQGE